MAEHMSCQEVVDLVTEYLDESLPADEASLFEQHVNFCEGCAWYLDEMRSTIAAVGRVTEEDLPGATRDRLLVAFRDWRRS
jgi:anti-sigma factor RsiW